MGIFDRLKKPKSQTEPFVYGSNGWKNNLDTVFRDYSFAGGERVRIVVTFITGRDGGKYPYVNLIFSPPILSGAGTVKAKIAKESRFQYADIFDLNFTEFDGGNQFSIEDLGRGVALIGDLRDNEDMKFALFNKNGEATVTVPMPNEGGFSVRYDFLRTIQATSS